MAYKFKNTSTVNIDIEGKIYPVRFTPELYNKLSGLSDFKAEGNVGEIVSGIDRLIDEILGNGSSSEIFASRPADVFERLDILKYICGEIKNAADRLKEEMKK